jgi:acyl-CoA reductase-like NAD-dependent aldehyde dehydrogenase
VEVRKEIYVGGQWAEPETHGSIDVIDSRTGDVMGSVPRGGGAEVERAVASARAAFPAWSQTSVPERAAALRAIADGLEARGEQLAETMSREVGTPIGASRRVQVGLSLDVFRSVADILADFPMETRIGNSLLIRQPAGVVAAITPWNYPLYQLAAKLAPALAAGCTTILKPASAAPLAAFVLAEVIDALDLPPGTVNVDSGPGSEIGERLAGHPAVDMVSITGSTQAGVRVAQAAARTVKRVTLELGGKSPFILLDDTDLAAALPVAVRSCFVNNGQTCSALTRLIVPRELMPAVEAGLADLVGAMRIGDPLEPGSDLGPMVSAGQRRTVWDYIEQGRAEGATLVTGGAGPPEGLDRGFYVRPTVFSAVTPDMVIAREEIFGPVLVVMPADSEDEAVQIANDCDYGLSGGVWSSDQQRAIAVARRLRTGQVAVNGGRFNVRAPFGGYRLSGVGRELGEHGLAEYFELTSLQLPAPAAGASQAGSPPAGENPAGENP